MKILEVSDLTTGYTDLDILHGISMHIESGEIVSIIGPNHHRSERIRKIHAHEDDIRASPSEGRDNRLQRP